MLWKMQISKRLAYCQALCLKLASKCRRLTSSGWMKPPCKNVSSKNCWRSELKRSRVSSNSARCKRMRSRPWNCLWKSGIRACSRRKPTKSSWWKLAKLRRKFNEYLPRTTRQNGSRRKKRIWLKDSKRHMLYSKRLCPKSKTCSSRKVLLIKSMLTGDDFKCKQAIACIMKIWTQTTTLPIRWSLRRKRPKAD